MFSFYFSTGVMLGLLVVAFGARWCFGARLNPLENNDKLQDINNQFVAEWQWESWPMKQEASEQETKSPGARTNVALWKDSSGPTWYLFGGRPVDGESKKIYSDVWKYSVTTRVWERFFPSQSEIKEANLGKIGGMMSLRANLFDEGHEPSYKPKHYDTVLCGGITKSNGTKTVKQDVWSDFARRKKHEEDKKEEEPRFLAVYAPRTSKANTVWQIDLKDKLWTAYVCCCDTTNGGKENSSFSNPLNVLDGFDKTKNKTATKSGKIEKEFASEKNESSIMDSRINKAEDEMDNEEQRLAANNSKTKKKKINQRKKVNENSYKKIKEVEKRSGVWAGGNTNKSKSSHPGEEPELQTDNSTIGISRNKNETNISNKIKKEKYSQKMKDVVKVNVTEPPGQSNGKGKTENLERKSKPNLSPKYCPEFGGEGKPVTWCDGRNEVLITTDVSSAQIILWTFNLRTSHWSQQKVNISENVDWSGCSSSDSVRYAGDEEEVYVICSFPIKQNETETPKDSTIPSRNPSEGTFTIKTVFRINYERRVLESLGGLRLTSYFSSAEGREIWQNDSKSTLQVIRTRDNETILLLAYLDSVDLWILSKDQEGRYYFDSIEKIWRGSALKWFNRYNAVLYNLHFITESGNSETILIPNPRIIAVNEYWPRERGRFIIRVFKNENLKNQSFENRTREQNLTFELLQSDFKPPAAENQLNRTYSLKVLVFFGISLAIFTVFGFVVFLKRCVTCPPRVPTRNEYHKSPLVIRYSVIPDDLLYPVA